MQNTTKEPTKQATTFYHLEKIKRRATDDGYRPGQSIDRFLDRPGGGRDGHPGKPGPLTTEPVAGAEC